MYNLQNVVDLENEVVKSFADIEYNGLNLDTEQWKTLEDINIQKADTLAINLDQIILENPRFWSIRNT